METGMDALLRDARAACGALIVDVRSPEEHAAGHIAGSVNVPLEAIARIGRTGADRDTPLYLYCHSGARAERARMKLLQMGFENVVNMGGILDWQGELVRGGDEGRNVKWEE